MTAATDFRLPLIDLDLLRTLVAIADSGNFSTAGQAVGRTPSAISMQVKRMEELIDRPLFVRGGRTVTLTRSGDMLVEHGRRLLALNRELVSRFVTPELVGNIRLGAPDDVAEQFLPGMLRQFADACPGVTVKVIINHSEVMMGMVERGELDLSLVTAEAGIKGDPGTAEIIYREPLVWAALAGGVACEQTPLPIAVWEPHCIWRKVGLEGLDAQEREYRIVFESAHASGQRAAILADLAIAQVPVSSIGGPIIDIGRKYNLPDLPPYALGLITGAEPSAAVEAAAAHIRRSFGNKRS